MVYHLKLRVKKRFPYKLRMEFFVRANFSTRLLKMSDVLDPLDEFSFEPFTSKDLNDCMQELNSTCCFVFFVRIVVYGEENRSNFSLNIVDSSCSQDENPVPIGEELFRSGKFSDVRIQIGSKEFFVHRCVLSLRSDVFDRMFSSDMIEARSNILKIDDLTEEIAEEMLRFIYCRKIDNLEKNALELLHAAEKYNIEDLKMVSIRALIDSLTVESAAEMLLRANVYNSKVLKENLLVFIKTYSRQIFQTEQWKQIERNQ